MTDTDPTEVFLRRFADPQSSGIPSLEIGRDFVRIMGAEHRPFMRHYLLGLILRTTDQTILRSLTNMPRFYYHLYYWYWDALKEFDRVILDDMIEVLSYLPVDIEKAKEHKLHRAVKVTKQKAKDSGNDQLEKATDTLMEKWQDLYKQHIRNDNENAANRETSDINPENASASTSSVTVREKTATSAPSRSVSGTSTDGAATQRISSDGKKKLALQKEPPPRAKAITDTRFFAELTANSKPNISSMSTSQVTHPVTIKPEPTTNTIESLAHTRRRPEEDAVSSSNESSTLSPVTTGTEKRSTKRVRFEQPGRLTQVRFFEVEDDEDESGMEPGGSRMDTSEGQQTRFALNPWYPPRRLILPEGCRRAASIITPAVMEENARQAVVLAAIYLKPEDIPFSPSEPDSPGDPNDHTPQIPLEDLEPATNPSDVDVPMNETVTFQTISEPQRFKIPNTLAADLAGSSARQYLPHTSSLSQDVRSRPSATTIPTGPANGPYEVLETQDRSHGSSGGPIRPSRSSCKRPSRSTRPYRPRKPKSETKCKFFRKTGGCWLAEECPYLHE